jgi:hypothetical protein
VGGQDELRPVLVVHAHCLSFEARRAGLAHYTHVEIEEKREAIVAALSQQKGRSECFSNRP